MLSTAPLKVSGNVSHRNELFIAKCNFVRKRILDYIGSGWELAIIPCSGTGAVEAMIASADGDNCNVLVNGTYAERMANIAGKYKDVVESIYDNNDGEMQRIKSWKNPAPGLVIPWIFMVHGETYSGVVNDLDAVLDEAKKEGKYVGIDAMSTFLFERIPFKNENLGMVAFSSCKGLKCNPGIGFVAYRPELVNENKKGHYLDVQRWSKDFPFTPTVTVIDELWEKFRNNVNSIYQSPSKNEFNSIRLRRSLRMYGFNVLVDDNYAMNCITVVQMDNIEEKNNLIEFCKNLDIEIYGGEGNTVRFSVINIFDGGDLNFDFLLSVLWEWKDDQPKR